MENQSKSIKVSLVLLVISLCLISTGIYIGYLSSSKTITIKALKNLAQSFNLNNSKQGNTNIKTEQEPGITSNTSIKINVNSQYLNTKVLEKNDYNKYKNLLDNLNNLENNITFSLDNKNKKLLLIFHSNLYNQPYINRKYLIQDTTEYKYIPELNENYINNGNNNYFETPAVEKNSIEYIYSIILESLKNNLTEKYFTTTQEERIIDNKKQTINKVSLEVNNTVLKQIINFIIKDLENDEKISNILKVTDNENNIMQKLPELKILAPGEKITLNIYTDKMGKKNIKYELVLINTENKITITYDCEQNTGQVTKNENLIYMYEVNAKGLDKKISIISKENKEIGSIILENNLEKNQIQVNYYDGELNIISNYIHKKITTKENYLSETIYQYNLRITNTTTELVNIGISINTDIENKAEIAEDVSSSVFKSSITEYEKNVYKNQMIEKISKLYQ